MLLQFIHVVHKAVCLSTNQENCRCLTHILHGSKKPLTKTFHPGISFKKMQRKTSDKEH